MICLVPQSTRSFGSFTYVIPALEHHVLNRLIGFLNLDCSSGGARSPFIRTRVAIANTCRSASRKVSQAHRGFCTLPDSWAWLTLVNDWRGLPVQLSLVSGMILGVRSQPPPCQTSSPPASRGRRDQHRSS